MPSEMVIDLSNALVFCGMPIVPLVTLLFSFLLLFPYLLIKIIVQTVFTLHQIQ